MIDQAHSNTTKHERKIMFRLIDTRKLSSDASIHAAQNERLPVRAVIQVLFSEQTKLNRITTDLSGSFGGSFSPHASYNSNIDLSGRMPSKREVVVQQQDIRKLRDDVARLQIQCHSLQSQLDRFVEKKKKKGGYFKWKSLLFRNIDVVNRSEDDDEIGVMQRTPTFGEGKKLRMRQSKASTPGSRNSTS